MEMIFNARASRSIMQKKEIIVSNDLHLKSEFFLRSPFLVTECFNSRWLGLTAEPSPCRTAKTHKP
jgi:hypothetical protein